MTGVIGSSPGSSPETPERTPAEANQTAGTRALDVEGEVKTYSL
jgi:hypothetical protein